jgi:hypothetical protein
VIIRDDGVAFDPGYPHVCLLPDERAPVAYYMSDRAGTPPHIAVTTLEIE